MATGRVLAKMIPHGPCNKLDGKAIGILQLQKEPYLPITSIHPGKSCRMALYPPLSFRRYAWNGEDGRSTASLLPPVYALYTLLYNLK